MAPVELFTAARMKQIEDESIVDGEVNAEGQLILRDRKGDAHNAGYVRGADATALMSVTDTTTVDLTLAGAGTPTDPWKLSAEMRALPSGAMARGLLHSEYRGGPAQVKIGGVLSAESFPFMSPYIPNGSREVNLMKVGTSWVILGQTTDTYIPLDYNKTLLRIYGERAGETTYDMLPMVKKLPSGLVQLSGMLSKNTGLTSNTVLAKLPVGYRPDFTMIFPIDVGDQAAAIEVLPNGDIRPHGVDRWKSGVQYFSLQNLRFWAAGVAQWTPIGAGGSSWGTNFQRNPEWDANYGPPSFWKDPYGFVWFIGLTQLKNNVSGDGVEIAQLPTTHRGWRQQHIRTVGDAFYSGIQSQPTQGLGWKTNSANINGMWISLSPAIVVTEDAHNNNPWYEPEGIRNGWVNNSATNQPPVGYLLREDGLRMTEGLAAGGTSGEMFVFRDHELWPNEKIIIPTMSGNLRTRVDINGYNDNASAMGRLVAQTTASWFSLDSLAWVP